MTAVLCCNEKMVALLLSRGARIEFKAFTIFQKFWEPYEDWIDNMLLQRFGSPLNAEYQDCRLVISSLFSYQSNYSNFTWGRIEYYTTLLLQASYVP